MLPRVMFKGFPRELDDCICSNNRSIPFEAIDVRMPVSYPTDVRSYDARTPVPPTTTCIEQLKRLTTDLMLLNTVDNLDDCIVIYAALNSVMHVRILSLMFPRTKFYCYDAVETQAKSSEMVRVMREPFSDELAEQWSKSPSRLIFISDMYIGDKDSYGESRWAITMEQQAQWVVTLKSHRWSVKARMSANTARQRKDSFKFLSGYMIIPAYAKETSMEFRLMGNANHAKLGPEDQEYFPRGIEKVMVDHNLRRRPYRDVHQNLFTQNSQQYSDPNFDHGYDCTVMLHSFISYMKRPGAVMVATTERDTLRLMNGLIQVISQGWWTLGSRKVAVNMVPPALRSAPAPSALTRRHNAIKAQRK